MHAWVEVEYSQVPPPEELRAMQQMALGLASDPNHISVRLGETDRQRPAIILEFEIKTQSQGQAVDRIFDSIRLYAGRYYADLTIRFPKRRRHTGPTQAR